MKDRSQLTQKSLKFDEIVRPNLQHDMSMLHSAITKDDHKTLSEFLEKDPTLVFEKFSDGDSPLSLALMQNDGGLIFNKLLVTIIKSSDNSNLEESFQLISQYSGPKILSLNKAMKSLLEKGVDIDVINNDGNTALHSAVLNDDLEMMNFLLIKGAKFDIKDKNGKNALELITNENQQKKLFSQAFSQEMKGKNLELVKTLFEMGFKYDEADVYEKAIESRNLELISFVVKDIGINPYKRDRLFEATGREYFNCINPVDYAISMALNPHSHLIGDESEADFLSKQEDIIKFFLKNGAMPNRDSGLLDIQNYPEFLNKLPPNLKELILKYDDASYFFDAPENVDAIKKVIESFLQVGADLENAQQITLFYYPKKEASTSGETEASTSGKAKSTIIELTALGIINLNRHISFDKHKRSSGDNDIIEKLHNKIKESRSKISPEEKLSDSAGISPPTSIGSRGPAQQSSLKRSRT
jgi:hypothetical protein